MHTSRRASSCANGPGDPSAVEYLYGTLRELIGTKPLFGICLGHQMLSLAVGADTYKLKYGHRGGNQPVKNLLSGQVEITSQNHGFCVDFASIGPLVSGDSGGLDHDAGDLGAWVESGIAPVVMSQEFGRVQLTPREPQRHDDRGDPPARSAGILGPVPS